MKRAARAASGLTLHIARPGLPRRAEGSVVVVDDVEFHVELDFKAARELDLPRVGVALDLPDELSPEKLVPRHEVGDLLRIIFFIHSNNFIVLYLF